MPKSKARELTDAFVRSAPTPSTGRAYLADTGQPGLQLVVTPTGRKSWWLQYRVTGDGRAGIPRRLSLGSYPAVSLAKARKDAKAHSVQADKGIDPAATRHQVRTDERTRPTVGDLAPRWLAGVAAKRSASSHANYEVAMRKYILPAIGRLKSGDVERRHVAALHHQMQDTPSGANRTLACLSVFMNWCEVEGARLPHSNPCYGIARYPETIRQRFLTHEELLRLGGALARAEAEGLPPSPAMKAKKGGGSIARRAKYGKDPKHPLRGPYKRTGADTPDAAKSGNEARTENSTVPADRYAVAALRLMLFTGWRLAEVVGTRWADVDLAHRVVRHRTTKAGATSRPLSAPAADLLAELPRPSTECPWVFPRAGDPTKHIGKPVRLWDAVRHASGLDAEDKAERVMPHDLRHSVGAVAASSGASLVVIASLLGHKQVRTTERYAHLSRDARHEAADRVGEIIADALKLGAEKDRARTDVAVVPIDRARRV